MSCGGKACARCSAADLYDMRQVGDQEYGALALAREAPREPHQQLHGCKAQPVDVLVELVILAWRMCSQPAESAQIVQTRPADRYYRVLVAGRAW